MGREKRKLPAAVTGGPKERHKRGQRSQYDPTAPVPEGFVAKPDLPRLKHHSYFEFVENKNKKKKLEFKITTDKTPPPGFEFVPNGNPLLTTACKELSREKDAMIFIVSNAKDITDNLAHQVHRIGHHIRETIVEEAQSNLGPPSGTSMLMSAGSPEPIPKTQEEYNLQVDAAIRDLFPRVPNTDRQMIIEHAFQRGSNYKGEKPVGLSEDITLARRVQLAVLAHIRHTHTRYDSLLRETTWQNARKVVEALCLDTLVKWRGDEETGRDQLDEILQEIVVISDSEDGEYDDDTDNSVEEIQPPRPTVSSRTAPNVPSQAASGPGRLPLISIQPRTGLPAPGKPKDSTTRAKRKNSTEKKEQRGFKRYNAWQEAIQRSRRGQGLAAPPSPGQTLNDPIETRPDRSVRLLDDEFPASSQLRIVSERAGPPPNENGFVGRFHQPQSRQAAHHTHRPLSPPSRAGARDQVRSPVPGVTHPVPLVADHFRDMLVPSIEATSSEAMKPSFVRSVPPRRQIYVEEIPSSFAVQYSPTVLSPSRGVHVRDGFAPATRLVPGSPLVHGGRPHHNDYEQLELRRRPDMLHRDGHPVADSSAYQSFARFPVPPDARPISLATRRFQESPRPLDHLAPTVMEDRGGFYERVPVGQIRPQAVPREPDLLQYRRPLHEAPRDSGRHHIVSWQEGSHILQENHGAGVETIPSTRSGPQEIRPASATAGPGTVYGMHRADTGQYLMGEPEYQCRPSFEPPLAPADHSATNHQPPRMIRTDGRAFTSRPSFESHPQEPPIFDDRQRNQSIRRRQPNNVVVIE